MPCPVTRGKSSRLLLFVVHSRTPERLSTGIDGRVIIADYDLFGRQTTATTPRTTTRTTTTTPPAFPQTATHTTSGSPSAPPPEQAPQQQQVEEGSPPSRALESLSALWDIAFSPCNPTSLDGIVVMNTPTTNNNEDHPSDTDMPGGSHTASPPRRPMAWAGQLAHVAGQTVQAWTVRRYALPDKHVASQVLMYRQLLHTKCRPGLTLSRDYQGTPAQTAVKDMPWWCLGVEETRKMVLSYDDLLKRLWVGGACRPFGATDDMLVMGNDSGAAATKAPVPHAHWVDRLGFQQTDPVTDFRSGGVLSLAMMVHLVDSCPATHARFCRPDGEASVLPFGITSINITDMMARFLMLSKVVDRMDALLSQRPFWRMFADPYALLVCQEVSMDVTADVVVEFKQERGSVTVFDFAEILKVVEERVERDLLGAGPKSVQELRALYQRNKIKYQKLLDTRMGGDDKKSDDGEIASPLGGVADTTNAVSARTEADDADSIPAVASSGSNDSGKRLRESMWKQATNIKSQTTKLAGSATSFAGNVLHKIKAPGFAAVGQTTTPAKAPASVPDLLSGSPPKAMTEVPPIATVAEGDAARTETIIFDTVTPPTSTGMPLAPPAEPNHSKASSTSPAVSDDDDWAKDIESATEGVSNFSIGGDEEEGDDEDL